MMFYFLHLPNRPQNWGKNGVRVAVDSLLAEETLVVVGVKNIVKKI